MEVSVCAHTVLSPVHKDEMVGSIHMVLQETDDVCERQCHAKGMSQVDGPMVKRLQSFLTEMFAWAYNLPCGVA